MNVKFYRGEICNLQNNNDPCPDEGSGAANKNSDTSLNKIIITNMQEISKEKSTLAAIQHNGNATLRFWQWRGYALSLFARLREVIMNDLIMPHCFDGELGLLNACFCPGGIKRVIDLVEPGDFYSDGGRLIFAKMVAFHKAGLSPTIFQVDTAFQDHQNYINIRSILDALLPFTAEDATYYAKIVKGLSNRRKAIKQAYATYLNLHDLTNPLPSDALQHVIAGGVHG